MKRIACTLLAWVILVAHQAQAQVPLAPQNLSILPIVKQPLPDGPLLSPAPDHSQYTVTSVSVPGAPGDPAASVTSTVSKSGQIYEVEAPLSPGQMYVRWNNKRMQASYLPGSASPMISSGGGNYYINFSESDYPDFSWISKRNYIGIAQLGGGKALLFKGKVEFPLAGALPLPFSSQYHAPNTPIETFAAVDLLTRRPLMLQADNELLIYQFTRQAPDLTLPKEVQDSFALIQKSVDRASRMPGG